MIKKGKKDFLSTQQGDVSIIYTVKLYTLVKDFEHKPNIRFADGISKFVKGSLNIIK
jgi:hypothetical protein